MPLKVLEWIKCLDLAQQALLIIFSQTTTTRLSKELLGCNWPDTTSHTQGVQKSVGIHSKKSCILCLIGTYCITQQIIVRAINSSYLRLTVGPSTSYSSTSSAATSSPSSTSAATPCAAWLLVAGHLRHPPLHLLQALQDRHSELVI